MVAVHGAGEVRSGRVRQLFDRRQEGADHFGHRASGDERLATSHAVLPAVHESEDREIREGPGFTPRAFLRLK